LSGVSSTSYSNLTPFFALLISVASSSVLPAFRHAAIASANPFDYSSSSKVPSSKLSDCCIGFLGGFFNEDLIGVPFG